MLLSGSSDEIIILVLAYCVKSGHASNNTTLKNREREWETYKCMYSIYTSKRNLAEYVRAFRGFAANCYPPVSVCVKEIECKMYVYA